MELFALPREPNDLRTPLTAEQIMAACVRAFGSGVRVESAHELAGGEFNAVYAVRIAGHEPLVLRAGPTPETFVPWHEVDLLRNEYALQPYFAPIATLMPRTVVADFTRQVMSRDFLFQSFMPGERWSATASSLAPDEDEHLWRELARIAKTIHSVEGTAFGTPNRQFATWSQTVLSGIERSILDAQRDRLDTDELREIATAAQAAAPLLDEVTRPRLMHGDLWTFNVLVEHGHPPAISAILDCDRGGWGDPFMEWTFHLLQRRASPHIQTIFWGAYGRPEPTRGQRVRELVYEGLHAGNVLSDVARRGRADLLPRIRDDLRRIAHALTSAI